MKSDMSQVNGWGLVAALVVGSCIWALLILALVHL